MFQLLTPSPSVDSQSLRAPAHNDQHQLVLLSFNLELYLSSHNIWTYLGPGSNIENILIIWILWVCQKYFVISKLTIITRVLLQECRAGTQGQNSILYWVAVGWVYLDLKHKHILGMYQALRVNRSMKLAQKHRHSVTLIHYYTKMNPEWAKNIVMLPVRYIYSPKLK